MALRPPYRLIDKKLREGSAVPFLGAGVNIRSPGTVSAGKALPTGGQLARQLAELVSFPSDDEHEVEDLSKVSSYLVETSARSVLRQELRSVFVTDSKPGPIHEYLASIQRPLLIVTTNYDDNMERALQAAGRPYDLVVHPTDRKDYEAAVFWWPAGATAPEKPIAPNKLLIDLTKTTVVYKMHGTMNRTDPQWDSYVVTEDDYVEFLSRMAGQSAVPSQFMRHFRTRHFLFMGYGLRDWNLRVLLRSLALPPQGEPNAPTPDEGVEERIKSWAIQYQPSPIERELWSARDVRIFDEAIDEFAAALSGLPPAP
ncbi:MAG: SIR2 family NAD-dependent protein deacylase [Gemmatimonadaceae bacterium]